jgi:hypothetical protein
MGELMGKYAGSSMPLGQDLQPRCVIHCFPLSCAGNLDSECGTGRKRETKKQKYGNSSVPILPIY